MSRASGVWPSREDYQDAVVDPRSHLRDPRLHTTRVETMRLGVLEVPFPRSGNFGAVYKFQGENETYAVKVFDKAQADRQLRYQLIHDHLTREADSPFLVTIHYDDQGIRVHDSWYPCLLMDWADGILLDLYLEDALRNGSELDNRRLCQVWVDMVLDLKRRRVAHGDLQHGNVLVMPGGTFKLVDYDGMFVPAMRDHGLTAAEIGLPAYQHPKRYRGYFDERLDDFSALVVLLQLAAADAELWQRYHRDDNCLLLAEPDLLRPAESPLSSELMQRSEPVRKLTVILRAASQGGLEAIPPFADVVEDATVKRILTGLAGPHRPPAPTPRPSPPPPPPSPPAPSPPPPAAPPPGEPWPELTPRQTDVLRLFARGRSEPEIADWLAIGKRTVSRHLAEIQRRVGVASPGELVTWARRNGFDRGKVPRAERKSQEPQELTPRQIEILRLMAQGYSDHDLAVALRVQETTVAKHLQRIATVTGSSKRRKMIRWAVDHAIVQPDAPRPQRTGSASSKRSSKGWWGSLMGLGWIVGLILVGIAREYPALGTGILAVLIVLMILRKLFADEKGDSP
ncbi:MAG: hypothetical protein GY856_36115 [bacterium]|nr:hypothetical protein [bacterium]